MYIGVFSRLAQPTLYLSSQGLAIAVFTGPLGENHGSRHREERVGLQPLKVPGHLVAKVDRKYTAGCAVSSPATWFRLPCARAPFEVLARLKGAVGQHHTNYGAVLKIKVGATRKE